MNGPDPRVRQFIVEIQRLALSRGFAVVGVVFDDVQKLSASFITHEFENEPVLDQQAMQVISEDMATAAHILMHDAEALADGKMKAEMTDVGRKPEERH